QKRIKRKEKEKRTMTKYICQRCKNEITPSELRLLPGVKCPKCSNRILLKQRSLIAKPVKAR
ncbi:MAG: hypothetical protein KAX32_00600, partial [Candidatus Heimdallarchaeota archaeon]|nr:hypothetical protein [Candidatus Heimdallarchaeota archaeon]